MSIDVQTVRESNREYHADTDYVSHSMLETFRESPALYYGRFVSREIGKEETPALSLGSLVHTLILEPTRIEQEYTISDSAARRGKDWDAAVARAMSDGTTPITQSEMDKALPMAEAVSRNVGAMRFIGHDDVAIEQSIRWERDGVKCKCRPDALIRLADRTIVIDLKTAVDPSPEAFGKAVWNYGYHRQAAWYFDGCDAWKDGMFLFVVVGKEPPHDVWMYELDALYLHRGQTDNYDDVARLMECRESGVWIAPGQDRIQSLEPPRWA